MTRPDDMHAPRGRILRVKEGYNPNSSSVGSIVFALPVAALIAPIAFGVITGVALSKLVKRPEGSRPAGTAPSPRPGTETPER